MCLASRSRQNNTSLQWMGFHRRKLRGVAVIDCFHVFDGTYEMYTALHTCVVGAELPKHLEAEKDKGMVGGTALPRMAMQQIFKKQQSM